MYTGYRKSIILMGRASIRINIRNIISGWLISSSVYTYVYKPSCMTKYIDISLPSYITSYVFNGTYVLHIFFVVCTIDQGSGYI